MTGQTVSGALLDERAAAVLRRNDLGRQTMASPSLYPHQWSWDSAFIAIGLAHLDTRRAWVELSSLFAAQWANGKVPHIVFNPDAPPGSYFPSGDHWKCAALTADAPRPPPRTSGLCQPPVHAIAARRIWAVARRRGDAEVRQARQSLADLYPRLFAWHRYLAEQRDPEGSGLVTIFHPWESGCDNAPRWDAPLAAVTPGRLPLYHRADLEHVSEAVERPTKTEYDRYLWLLQCLRQARYDTARAHRSHPFLVKDVLASAILVAANEALDEVARVVDAPADDRDTIRRWRERGRQGVEGCWDASLGLCLDYDLRADRPLPGRTVAGFALLIAGAGSPERIRTQLEALDSAAFCGHPELRWPLTPSASPLDPGFHSRSYWRGPVWPVLNWLLWWALRRAGAHDRAAGLRAAALGQLEIAGTFPEYVEPFTGEALGSADQSWTAAVALDWLADA